MKKLLVRKDSYFDSVFLMLLSREAKKTPGVRDAVTAMATDMNKALLADLGYGSIAAGPNDLLIAVDAEAEDAVMAGIAAAEAALTRKKAASGAAGAPRKPAGLEAARRELPEANLAVISLPGAYAGREARRALQAGLHVMLYSDNVSLEEEIELKRLAREKGLLLMGPDCGTAIVNGTPLCFANAVARGPVGVAGASGTGIQEVTCLLDRFGSGVSQALGTGGRDLKNEKVGGITMLMAVEALGADPATKVLVVISKPPAPAAADKVIAALKKTGKPAVVHFIGLDRRAESAAAGTVHFADNLEQCAGLAAGLARGVKYAPRVFDMSETEIAAVAERELMAVAPGQKYLRGLFTGGTLADEALLVLHRLTGAVYSNNQTDPRFILPDPRVSVGHSIVDLGDDVFTVGRPHPMIEPTIRVERILRESEDPEVALLLLDLVLGYGSHADPAGAMREALVSAREAARRRGGYLAVLASVTGAPGDPQGFEAQRRKLEEIGCVVMPSNHQAARLAEVIMRKLAERKGALA